ncbi:MAG: hypothetical protein AAB612_02270 [Patescibacteria group bacterium]
MRSSMEVLEAYNKTEPGTLTSITAEEVKTLKKSIADHHNSIEETAWYLAEQFPKRCEDLVGWSFLDHLKNRPQKTAVLAERLIPLLTDAAALNF